MYRRRGRATKLVLAGALALATLSACAEKVLLDGGAKTHHDNPAYSRMCGNAETWRRNLCPNKKPSVN